MKGRLYQYRRGAPGVHDAIRLKEGEKVQIIIFRGPSLPGPGVVADMTFAKPDGSFEMRLPPGLHYLSLPNSQKSDGTYRLPYCDMGEPCTEERCGPSTTEPPPSDQNPRGTNDGNRALRLSAVAAAAECGRKEGTENAKPASPQFAVPDALKEPKIVDYHVGKDEIGGMCLVRGEARSSRASTFRCTSIPSSVGELDGTDSSAAPRPTSRGNFSSSMCGISTPVKRGAARGMSSLHGGRGLPLR